jgi:hypothetical protein
MGGIEYRYRSNELASNALNCVVILDKHFDAVAFKPKQFDLISHDYVLATAKLISIMRHQYSHAITKCSTPSLG